MRSVRLPDSGAQPRVPSIFRIVNAAIANADAERDAYTVDLLLIAKLAMVRHHERLPREGGRA